MFTTLLAFIALSKAASAVGALAALFIFPVALIFREVAAGDARVRRLEVTLGFADITAAGMTKTIDYANALPADAFLLGTSVNVTDDFDDGAACTTKVDIGVSGSTTSIIAGSADSLGTIARIVGGTKGASYCSIVGAITPRLTFTGSVNLNTLTKGSVTIAIYFMTVDKTTAFPNRG